MSGAKGGGADRRDVFVALDLSGGWDEPVFARLGGRREEMQRQFLQRLALLVIGLFVDVNIVEIPFAERFEHALVLGALDELTQGQPIQRNLSITAFRDKNDLRTVTGHARRERFEPAGTG